MDSDSSMTQAEDSSQAKRRSCKTLHEKLLERDTMMLGRRKICAMSIDDLLFLNMLFH